MKKPLNIKKLLLPNIPYVFIALFATKLGQAWRLAPGTDFSGKVLHIMEGFAAAFQSALPSFQPIDLCVGVAAALLIRLVVYVKGRNAKKFRKNLEYGSARWGKPEDIAPYVDPKFENNVILTQTERLMVQGTKRQSFYENRGQYKKPREEWIIVENTHEPLIDRETFDKVQELAQRRNEEYFEKLGRFSHLETTENILKGLIYCADCKRPLVRYKNVSHEKKLWYTFICQTHANDITSCPKKNIREDVLTPMLLQAIQTQIVLAADMETVIRRVNSSPKYRKQTATLQGRLDAAKRSLNRCNGLYDSLYQNYVDRLMTEQEYMTLKRHYKAEAEEAERLIEALTRQQAEEAAHTPENPFLAAFGSFRGADTLTREMAQALIERVYVDGDSNIEIVFRYRDEYKELCTYLEGRETDA